MQLVKSSPIKSVLVILFGGKTHKEPYFGDVELEALDDEDEVVLSVPAEEVVGDDAAIHHYAH